MQKGGAGTTSYPIHSVGKALALLSYLQSHPRVRVMDVSQALGVAPSTAHRLLAMFVEADMLTQEDHHSVYTIGPALIQFATSVTRRLDIVAMIRPHLIDLVRELNETAHVCLLSEGNAVFVDCVESTHSLRAVSRTGRAMPAYATAGGKALLAELSVPEIVRLFPNEDLPGLTRKTIRSRQSLVRALRQIREQGYATNAEESELDFAACAAVVRDRSGTARAAIITAGPASRFKRYDAGQIAATVCAACAVASAALI